MNQRSTFRAASLLSATVAIAATFSAHAQDATPAAIAVPAMDCQNPGAMPIDNNPPSVARFQKRVNEYQTCVNTYAKAQGAKATEYAAQAQAYNNAANKAVDDFNQYAHGLNEQSKNMK